MGNDLRISRTGNVGGGGVVHGLLREAYVITKTARRRPPRGPRGPQKAVWALNGSAFPPHMARKPAEIVRDGPDLTAVRSLPRRGRSVT